MRGWLLIASTVLPCCFASASDQELSYRPVWSDISPNGWYVPLQVVVKNNGANTAGILTTQSSGAKMAYPIELPRGADKSIEVYFSSSGFGSSLSLETGAGKIEQEIDLKGASTDRANTIGVITQSPGGFAGLKNLGDNKHGLNDSYCVPTDAPARSIGYDCVQMVVLGRGSERISDAAVAAIKRYVLKGGRVLFCGGASPIVLRDARWGTFLPVQVRGTENSQGSEALSKFTGISLKEQLTLSRVDVNPGVQVIAGDQSHPLIVRSQVGLGRVDVVLFDLFDDPIRTWTGRPVLIQKIVGERPTAQAFLYSDDGNQSATYSVSENDPFQVKLTSPWIVTGLMWAFVVVAIPINFLILGKLKKKELAWLTLPIVSLAFSGIFFAASSSLYSARSARSTTGTLVVHDGLRDAVFVGRQQLFFPHSGRYDLGFQNVEWAAPPPRYDRPMRFSDPQKAPELVDVGQVVAPMFEVSNLAFREFQLTQQVAVDWRIQFSPTLSKSEKGWKVVGTLKNQSPYDLAEPQIWFEGSFKTLPMIKAGAIQEVDVTLDAKKAVSRTDPAPSQCLAMVANVKLDVGSQYGSEVEGRNKTRLLYSWSQGGPR